MAPVLSICIPTYNRAGYLYFTLKSIVEQEIFQTTDDVEIVISDNFSNDLTEKIVKIFIEKYPDKIIYNKNEKNICDENFEKVLKIANGEVLKLHNDNFVFIEGSLSKIVNMIKENREQKPVLFFANGNSRVNESKLCNNFDEFVEAASYLTTWIASFSIWREDFEKFEDFSKNVETQLMQTDVVFRFCAEGRQIYVVNDEIFEGQSVLKKGGYNIPKIFGKNYLYLLKPYVKNSKLNKKVYEHEKKVLLLNHIIPMKFSSSRREAGWQFKDDGYWRHLFKDYWMEPYFYFSIVKIFRLLLDSELNLFARKLNPNSYQKYWRKRNRHNGIFITKNTDSTKILVGKNSKGTVDAEFSNNPNQLLLIENNVTIEPRVKFIFDNNDLIIVKDDTIIKSGSIVKE